jgi:hypothetical protein
MAANDGEGDGRASLKAPPLKGVVGGAIDPVGLEPVDDVLVTGDGDEALLTLADRPGQGVGADLGDGAIDRARELIDDGEREGLGEEAGHQGAELLAGGEDVERAQPGGGRREADGGEELDDLLDRHGRGKGVEDGAVGGPV